MCQKQIGGAIKSFQENTMIYNLSSSFSRNSIHKWLLDVGLRIHGNRSNVYIFTVVCGINILLETPTTTILGEKDHTLRGKLHNVCNKSWHLCRNCGSRGSRRRENIQRGNKMQPISASSFRYRVAIWQ